MSDLTIEALRHARALLEDAPPPLRIIENSLLAVAGPTYEVRRTWRERLFSLPWRPSKATRAVTPWIPSPHAYALPDGSLVMHPTRAREVRDAIHRSKP